MRRNKFSDPLIIGAVLLLIGWIMSFFLVVFEIPYKIIISIISYTVSIVGLILSTLGLTKWIKGKLRE